MTNQETTPKGRGRKLATTVVLGIAIAIGIMAMLVANVDSFRQTVESMS